MIHALLLAVAATPSSCNRDPVMTVAIPARVPKDSQASLASGKTVTIEVSVDASGRVTNAAVYQGTGIPAVDDAAKSAASASTYEPAYAECKPVPETFLVTETIVPNGIDLRNVKTSNRCAVPFREVTPHFQSVVTPAGDASQDTGEVIIELTIDERGKISNARITQSSGIFALDRAALSSAHQSTFFPKIVNCEPVTGTYLFKVTYGRKP